MQAPTDLTAPDLAAVDSPEGTAWMAAVPSLLHGLARQWNLVTVGDLFWHGCNAVVFPVRQGSRPLALKLAWPEPSAPAAPATVSVTTAVLPAIVTDLITLAMPAVCDGHPSWKAADVASGTVAWVAGVRWAATR